MESSATSHLIGVVDGDDAVRDSTGIYLETLNYSVATYASATAFLRAGAPHCLLVVNHRLPDMSGLDLVETLRAGRDQIPAIVMADFVNSNMTMQLGLLGSCTVLRRPFRADELVTLIARYCAASRCRH